MFKNFTRVLLVVVAGLTATFVFAQSAAARSQPSLLDSLCQDCKPGGCKPVAEGGFKKCGTKSGCTTSEPCGTLL